MSDVPRLSYFLPFHKPPPITVPIPAPAHHLFFSFLYFSKKKKKKNLLLALPVHEILTFGGLAGRRAAKLSRRYHSLRDFKPGHHWTGMWP